MKSILIIGIGHFGAHLTRQLADLGNEVMIIDKHEEQMEDLLHLVTGAKIGDCTEEQVLKSLDVDGFDLCFVCIGGDFQANLVITTLLKDFGAKYVISKVEESLHARLLLRNGADEVVYPDRDITERIAVAVSSDQVFDYFDLEDGYGIYEIAPEKEWVGKSIAEVNVRLAYGINIIAVKKDGATEMNPAPDYIFKDEEHLLVIGHKNVIGKLVKTY